MSDCRSGGRELDPGPVPYFCGDYEIISMVILLPSSEIISTVPLIHSRRAVVSQKPKFDHGPGPYFGGDNEIISMVILLPSADSFKKVCCQLHAKVCAQSTG